MPINYPRDTKSPRIRGRKLQRIRFSFLSRHPLCAECLKREPPRIRAATEVDHILALCNGGADTEDNRQGLCAECHEDKTRRDLGHKAKPRIGLDGWPVKE